MKRTFRQVLASLIALSLVVACFPSYVFADETDTNESCDEVSVEGTDEESGEPDVGESSGEETGNVPVQEETGNNDTEYAGEDVAECDENSVVTTTSVRSYMAPAANILTASSLSGSGTQADPYLITSAADWTTFATYVNSNSGASGKYFKLTNNISINYTSSSQQVGNSAADCAFQGVFDGDAHTITFSSSFDASMHGLFRHIKNATIKNLNINGTITGGAYQYHGILAGTARGTCKIYNVNAYGTINNSNNNAACGGLIGWACIGGGVTSSSITIQYCRTTVSYIGKTGFACFVGAVEASTTLNIRNSFGLIGANTSINSTSNNGLLYTNNSGTVNVSNNSWYNHQAGYTNSNGYTAFCSDTQGAVYANTDTLNNNGNTENFWDGTRNLIMPQATLTAPTAKTNLSYTGSAQVLVNSGSATNGTLYYRIGSSGTWSTSVPTATNAGTYTVYAKACGNDQHRDSDVASVNVTIGKVNSSVSTAPTAKTLTYTGSDQALVNAGTASGGTMQYCLTQDGTYSATIPTGTNAGDYTVWYRVVGDSNHNNTTVQSIDVTINKATPVVTAPTAKDLTYTGSAQELINPGTTTGGTLQYRVNGGVWSTEIPKGIDAGTYSVSCRVEGDANFNGTEIENYPSYAYTHCYDAYRSPAYPRLGETCEAYNFNYPLNANGEHDNTITEGTWSLTYYNKYSAISSPSDNLEYLTVSVANAYDVTDTTNVPIYELKVNGTHIAYGILCAVDEDSNCALFIGDTYYGGAGYVLANEALSGEKYFTINKDITTSMAESSSLNVTIAEYTPLLQMTAESSKMHLNVYVPYVGSSAPTVTLDGASQTLEEVTKDNKKYGVFTITCAAKNMVDTKTLVVMDGNTQLYEGDISAASYLKSINNGNYDQNYKNVAIAMLRYGSAAQIVLNNETDPTKLANYGVDAAAISTLSSVTMPAQTSSAEDISGAFSTLVNSEYYGMNMTYTYDTTLLIAFRIESGADEYDAKTELVTLFGCGEDNVVKDTTEKYWVVKVQNIPICNLDNPMFTFDNVQIKATDYLARITADGSGKSDDLKNLCKALYAYYLTASALQSN